MRKTGRSWGAWSLVLCAASISTSSLLHKFAYSAGLHPIWVSALRLGIAVLILTPFLLHYKKTHPLRMARRDLLLTLLAGGMLALHFATWSLSLQYADALVATACWSTFSLMTVVGSALMLREKTPLPALVGIVLATAGVAVCAMGATGSTLMGIAMALGAALFQAIYTLCGRAVRRRVDMLPYTMLVYSTSFVLLLGWAVIGRLPTVGINAHGLSAALLLALICTLGGHSMQSYALKFYSAPTISAAILTEVITGPLLVYVFLGEVPPPQSLMGGAVILAGVAWYMYCEWKGFSVKKQETGVDAPL
jgi:drug/metabolite transporter (DMT)-like permease